MTTPDYTPQPSDADFGPDSARTPEDEQRDVIRERLAAQGTTPPKVNQKNPPKPGRSAFSSLGQNKKPRSGIRKLNTEDRDKIASLYTFGAMGLMPFKANAAKAMAGSADACADAWIELAQENDTVRRVLLMLIEGGVWGKVFAAHTPILIALLPESVMPQMFRGVDMNDMFNPPEDGSNG